MNTFKTHSVVLFQEKSGTGRTILPWLWMKISMQSLEKKWRIPISKCNLSDSWFWKSSQSTFILQRIPNTYISINKNTFYFFMVVLDFVYTFFNVAEILYMSLCYHWLMNVKRKKKKSLWQIHRLFLLSHLREVVSKNDFPHWTLSRNLVMTTT